MIHIIRDGRSHSILFALILGALLLPAVSLAQSARKLPEKVPPKRTSQIEDGFGINSDLPRDPYAMESLVVDAHV